MSQRSRARLHTEELESKRLFAGDVTTGGFQGPPVVEDRVAAIFDRFDANDDDHLDADEVRARVWTRLSMADANEDGAVSTEELTAHIEAKIADRPTEPPRQRPTPSDMAERLISRLDDNQDGLLDADEVSESRWEQISTADTDGDEAISTEELTAHIEARIAERPTSAEIADRIMSRRDANEDGLLVAEEVSVRQWDRLSAADIDGDEAVSTEELTAHIDAAMAEKDGDDVGRPRRERFGRGLVRVARTFRDGLNRG